MGLLDSLKKVYYNNRFSKAKKNIEKGNLSKARDILIDIKELHPEALTELAKLDFEKATHANDPNLFKNVIDLELQLVPMLSNYDSFYSVLYLLWKEVDKRINNNLDNNKYLDAYKYAELLLKIKLKNDDTNNIHNLNKYGEVKLSYAISLKNSDLYKAKEILIELFESNKWFNNEMLKKIHCEILALAQLFSDRWNDYSHCNDLCKLIFEKNERALILYIENCCRNIKQIDSDEKEKVFFYKKLNSIGDFEIVKKYYEEIIHKSGFAKDEYINFIICISTDCVNKKLWDKSISILDEALKLITSESLVNQKVEIIRKYPCKIDDKIERLSLLIGFHKDVEPLLAQTFVLKSQEEEALDRKKYWLEKSYSFKSTNSKVFNKKLYTEIFKSILFELNSLAIKYADIGYYEDAYGVLSLLYLHFSSAIPLENYCKTKVKESKTVSSYGKKIDLLKESISFAESIAKKYFSGKYVIEVILVEMLVITESQIQKVKDENERLAILSSILEFVSTHKKKSETLDRMLDKEKAIITNLLFDKGKRFEKIKNIYGAIQIYSSIREQYGLHSDIEIRYLICQLKIKHTIPSEIETQIHDILLEMPSDENIIELAYRYSLYLLNNNNQHEKAIAIIDKYLPQSSESYKIRQYCKNESIKSAIGALDAFNHSLSLMNNNELSLDSAREIIETLDSLEKTLAKKLPDLKSKFLNLQRGVKNYILRKMFEIEDYQGILDIISDEEGCFHKNNIVLHNSAVAAFGIAQIGRLTLNNYKKFISIWITAVFQDILFIESLHYTSWDDQYSFSLLESLGRIGEDIVLPENINYENPNSFNISIGEVQQLLLEKFRIRLLDKSLYNSSDIEKFEKFYNTEVDAITDLFSLNLGQLCFHATPYYCVLDKTVFTEIKKSLENEFGYTEHEVDYEMVLETGLKYGINTKRYKDYELAKTIYSKLVCSAEKINTPNISEEFNQTNISLLRKHATLFNNLIIKIKSILDNHVKTDTDFAKIYNAYSVISKQIGDANLWFAFANYVLNDTVKNVNSNSLSKYNALKKLYDIYCNCPDHQRLCGDMVTLCDMLIEEEIMLTGTNSHNTKKILNNLINNRSSTFRAAASKLFVKYNSIIAQLDPTNRILMTGPSNIGLGGISLNEKGLAIKEGLDYYKKISQ